MDNYYVHEALPRQDAIRLFLLDQGCPDDPISGKIVVRHGDRARADEEYHALSYTWGSPFSRREEARLGYSGVYEQEHVITCNGKSMKIMRNLFDALKELRRRLILSLWIDAICINQSDPEEKLIQIQLMGNVYLDATTVIVWLGPDGPGSKETIGLVNNLTDFDDLDDSESPDTSGIRGAMEEAINDDSENNPLGLFRRTWFHRVWTFQEMAIPHLNELVGMCGSYTVDIFKCCLVATFVCIHEGEQAVRSDDPDDDRPDFYAISSMLQWIKCRPFRDSHGTPTGWHNRRRNISLLSKNSTPLSWWAHITEMLVYDMRRRLATEPRDSVLAPLALAIVYLDIKAHWPGQVDEYGPAVVIRTDPSQENDEDVLTGSLLPALFQLNQTVPGLFRAFTILILKLSSSLNILSHVDDRPETLCGFHSWVPNFAQGCGDSLIDYGRYCAAANLGESKPSFPKDILNPGCTLLCTRGIYLGKIKTVIREGPYSMTLDQIVSIGLQAQAAPHYASSHIDELICLTSFADRAGPYTNEAPSLSLTAIYFSWIIRKLIDALTKYIKLSSESEPSSSIENFWHDHEDYRTLFRSRLFQDWCVFCGFSSDGNGEYCTTIIREIEANALKNSTASEENSGELGSNDLWLTQVARLSKRFFLSDIGYLGLGPIRMQLDDEVWVLQGGDVAFILRRLDNGRHLLVGEAYVHGVMMGELVPDDENNPLQTVYIQ